MNHTIKTTDGAIKALKSELETLKSKKWGDNALRILDQHELSGKPWGADCTLQVMSYETGYYQPTGMHASLESLNRFVRVNLGWDGRVCVAVAA